jgi:hypothetical protein
MRKKREIKNERERKMQTERKRIVVGMQTS